MTILGYTVKHIIIIVTTASHIGPLLCKDQEPAMYLNVHYFLNFLQ